MKLPAKIKARWVKALRSGEFKQTTGTLCDGTGYCCLGVLEQVTEGKIERDDRSTSGYRGDPSVSFWNRIGAEVDEICSPAGGDYDYVSDKHISRLVKMNDGAKWYDNTKKKAVQTRKHSFNKIADWIDKHIEVLD